LLKVPAGPSVVVPNARGHITRTEPAAVLSTKLLKAMVKLSALLKVQEEAWAIVGDAGEQVQGVNVSAVDLGIITTEKGCESIAAALGEYRPPAPEGVEVDKTATREFEKKLERDADIGGVPFPIFIRGLYAEFVVDGVRVEVLGDPRIKVGELPWGDRIEFEPGRVNIVGASLPVFPIALKRELYLGLGWVDRAQKITDALRRAQSSL
jgi:hypothetical protein